MNDSLSKSAIICHSKSIFYFKIHPNLFFLTAILYGGLRNCFFFITFIYFFQCLFGLLFPFSLWTFISLFLFGLLFNRGHTLDFFQIFILKILFYEKIFANFNFWNTLFSKIMHHFCRTIIHVWLKRQEHRFWTYYHLQIKSHEPIYT